MHKIGNNGKTETGKTEREMQMRDSRTQTQKLAHAFLTSVVVIVSAILIAMGVCAAKNNTDALDRGVQPAMISAARRDRQISVTVNRSVYDSPPLPEQRIITALRFAPAPWGSLCLIGETLAACLTAQ